MVYTFFFLLSLTNSLTLISDTFNYWDTTTWITHINEDYNSNVTFDGRVIFKNRGWLATENQYRPGRKKHGGVGDLFISGVYTFGGTADDSFTICTRAELELSTNNNYGVSSGICFTIETGNPGQIRIEGFGNKYTTDNKKCEIEWELSAVDVNIGSNDTIYFGIYDRGDQKTTGLNLYVQNLNCDPEEIDGCSRDWSFAYCWKMRKKRGYHIVMYNKQYDYFNNFDYYGYLHWIKIEGEQNQVWVPPYEVETDYTYSIVNYDASEFTNFTYFNSLTNKGLSTDDYDFKEDSFKLSAQVQDLSGLSDGIQVCPYSKRYDAILEDINLEYGLCIKITPTALQLIGYAEGQAEILGYTLFSGEALGTIDLTANYDAKEQQIEVSAFANGQAVAVLGKQYIVANVALKGEFSIKWNKIIPTVNVGFKFKKFNFCFKKKCRKNKKKN